MKRLGMFFFLLILGAYVYAQEWENFKFQVPVYGIEKQVQVRKAPSFKAKRIQTIPLYHKMLVIDYVNKKECAMINKKQIESVWYQVFLEESGRIGWVYGGEISFSQKVEEPYHAKIKQDYEGYQIQLQNGTILELKNQNLGMHEQQPDTAYSYHFADYIQELNSYAFTRSDDSLDKIDDDGYEFYTYVHRESGEIKTLPKDLIYDPSGRYAAFTYFSEPGAENIIEIYEITKIGINVKFSFSHEPSKYNGVIHHATWHSKKILRVYFNPFDGPNVQSLFYRDFKLPESEQEHL